MVGTAFESACFLSEKIKYKSLNTSKLGYFASIINLIYFSFIQIQWTGRARLSNGLEINRMSPGIMCSSNWNSDAG